MKFINVHENFSELETTCDYADRFENLLLTCNSSKPSVVLPELTVTWFQDGLVVDGIIEQSNNGILVTNTLTLNSTESREGGNYTCVAEILIPESPNITESMVSQVAPQGKIQID